MHLIVTGTDTGVGKTFVSALLALNSNRKYWKPIQSGSEARTDSEWVAEQIGASKILPEVYRLTQPLSPHFAARLDGVCIELKVIVDFYEGISHPMIIEGVGGLLVPINERELMIDLIRRLDCPALLVARSTLGTINHTLLSLEAVRSRGIYLVGVIMVGPINLENKLAIEKYGKTRVVAQVPWVDPPIAFALQQMASEMKEGVEKWISL